MIYSATLKYGIVVNLESDSPSAAGSISLSAQYPELELFFEEIREALRQGFTAHGKRFGLDRCRPTDLFRVLKSPQLAAWLVDSAELESLVAGVSPGEALFVED